MNARSRILLAVLSLCAAQAHATPLTSPDRHISVDVSVSNNGNLTYTVSRDGKPVILPSALGLQLQGADLSSKLRLSASSPVKLVRDSYELATAKKGRITYSANEQTHTVRNAAGQAMDLSFRVSNDGVAFRYVVRAPKLQFISESTSFAFDPATRAWLQPMSVAQTGWMNTNPSYEEHYQREIPVGTPSKLGAGWAFPALFRTGDTWVALTEANMDGSFHASRLASDSPGGVYRLAPPAAPEVFTNGALLAEGKGELATPWRIITLGSLKTLVESTLGTDLAAPAVAFDKARIQPGHASWSWALLKDDATVFDVQKRFVDYAADMKWDYTLVDADWDRKIGFEKLRELVQYAEGKGVGILVWYNSSGAWNKTEYGPKGALLAPAQRRKEFERLREIGVKGVKVDFFAGDGKSMIAYYVDILNDAAKAGLLVNFHGATLPRGWSRTYPNLMTVEAIRGLEFTTFEQVDQDAVPAHAAMLPFARNLFDPMDFTPMVFGDIPNIKRATRNGFELAESVLFLSGIQHFAERPEGMATVPSYVKALLQDLPRSWDDVRFIDGYPGRYAIIARRSGDSWYVAGINADGVERSVDLDLSFLDGRSGTLATDGDTERSFTQAPIGGGTAKISIKPHGGFVAVFK
ncbi:glycoside hydrolase family 97 protein [Massilia sp. ZL223]|uniref:glycoside hydrolase family 97 protein n=1 Tax=Massilia sp. ZL223 TaxID=2824904 RepID=UPI001B83DC76|nr:glycoside hydrolase family 97 protein [Massilia sp. ZL223]MBQ5963964.1 glycoside hydrolase family 97 catalytic domain-containing protein [Massilia sp. ZL223]